MEVKPLIKSWNENNLKNIYPRRVVGFIPLEIRKFAFLSDILFRYNYFLYKTLFMQSII